MIKYHIRGVDSVCFVLDLNINLGYGGYDHGVWVNEDRLKPHTKELIEIVKDFPGFMGVLSYGYFISFAHGRLFDQRSFRDKVVSAMKYIFQDVEFREVAVHSEPQPPSLNELQKEAA